LIITSQFHLFSLVTVTAEASSLEPLPLHEILAVRAGCVGFHQAALPVSGKGRSKGKGGDNKHSSLFLTIKATQTPMATSRLYIFRFKSRAARNNLMLGLRGLLANLQIHEGVSISSIHLPKPDKSLPRRRLTSGRGFDHQHEEDVVDAAEMDPNEHTDVSIPLRDVHYLVNKEREAYDRLLLIMLQGSSDLKEKEDDDLALREKLEEALAESFEKDRIAANDRCVIQIHVFLTFSFEVLNLVYSTHFEKQILSFHHSKLIMQLSKKLETLLMDNEDLRDQNDRLNTRLVTIECEKMNEER
jgi:hypothetical protein